MIPWLANWSKKSSPTTAYSDQLALVPGRMRRTCTSLWALCSGYGLYALLGITGLGLACVFATHALRSVRVNKSVNVELPTRSEFYPEVEGRELANKRSVFHKPLVGMPLRSWISPWCVGYAAIDGGWYWVFKDEVSAPVYADIRRRLITQGKA